MAMTQHFMVFNAAAQVALDALNTNQTAQVVAWVTEHARELDFSNGSVVGLSVDAQAIERQEYECCGWADSRLRIGGVEFYVGSCYGH